MPNSLTAALYGVGGEEDFNKDSFHPPQAIKIKQRHHSLCTLGGGGRCNEEGGGARRGGM